jgi:hypothetical protein
MCLILLKFDRPGRDPRPTWVEGSTRPPLVWGECTSKFWDGTPPGDPKGTYGLTQIGSLPRRNLRRILRSTSDHLQPDIGPPVLDELFQEHDIVSPVVGLHHADAVEAELGAHAQ